MRKYRSEIVAVLGPTNTGKTHYAIEQMLAHKSGLIGLPLRLLAREVFEKMVGRVGNDHVALITGEEKIIPTNPKYWVCTVEAMPREVNADFLAVDEIQLCADRERGHVFTDRLLNWRGNVKTMFLGSDTVRGVLARLVSEIRFETKTRFSKLTFAGYKKISKLPPRSAIVAFSAGAVYSIAELVRQQRGGAAVIMGNLSPRTRNAQVELYQSGEVNYLVATDAIGMGLNMEIDHVAFSALRKYDGVSHRDLSLGEMGQIAGRAGRYLNDGTFGISGAVRELDMDAVLALESHDFAGVNVLQWRNRNLNYSSIDGLKASLLANPNRPELTRARYGADFTALDILSVDEQVKSKSLNRQDVARLWDVCQLPDYRNISSHDHAGIILKIFDYLSGPAMVIDEDWFSRQLNHCDNILGDIDTISNRISHIRTWTFVANRSGWLKDPFGWRKQTREIEDKLSDALHQALIQRFIDRRTSLLMKKLRQREEVMSSVEENGSVVVEGQEIGTLSGFRFTMSIAEDSAVAELKAEANKVVAQEVAVRAGALIAVPDQDISLSKTGEIIWQGAEIAKIVASENILKPTIAILADDHLESSDKEAIEFRVQKFLERHIAGLLQPLINLVEDENISGLAKGVGFQLVEKLGVLARNDVASDIKALDQAARSSLRKHGIRFGAFHIFIPVLLKPAATQLRLLLWALQQEKTGNISFDKLPEVPGQGLTSAQIEENEQQAGLAGYYLTAGFKVCGSRIVRVDMLERLGDMIRERVFWRPVSELQTRPEGSVEGGGFSVVPDMMSLVGCSGDVFSGILRALDFKAETRDLPVQKIEKPEVENVEIENSEVEKLGSEKIENEPVQEGEAAPELALSKDSSNKATETLVQTEEKAPELVPVDASTEGKEEAPTTFEVWWPKDTGPFRQKRPSNKSGQRPNHKSGKQSNPKKFSGNKPGHAGPRNARKPNHSKKAKPSRPIRIEDSPFAALAALKNDLKK